MSAVIIAHIAVDSGCLLPNNSHSPQRKKCSSLRASRRKRYWLSAGSGHGKAHGSRLLRGKKKKGNKPRQEEERRMSFHLLPGWLVLRRSSGWLSHASRPSAAFRPLCMPPPSGGRGGSGKVPRETAFLLSLLKTSPLWLPRGGNQPTCLTKLIQKINFATAVSGVNCVAAE